MSAAVELVCHACRQHALEPIASIEDLKLVTSDCRPWENFAGTVYVCTNCQLVQKSVTQTFRDQTRTIYETYRSYAQSGGLEQSLFSFDGGQAKRSDKILDYLERAGLLGDSGNMLDFGCGTGNFLRAFRARRDGWMLYGSDYGDQVRETIESISGARYFRSGEDLPVQFNLITASHVLEHLADPASLLRKLERHLTPLGILLVQVPNIRQSPFDILIADHCSHFSVNSLANVIASSGMRLLALSDNVAPKEITAVLGGGAPEGSLDESLRRKLDGYLRFFHGLLDGAIAAPRPLGVFGSSISASWLVGELPQVEFFVDEDLDRVGSQHLGRPILGLADIPRHAHVLMPLEPALAKAIERRLARPDVRFLTPQA